MFTIKTWVFIVIFISIYVIVSAQGKYAVVIDAGSTGSRVFIYQFEKQSDGNTKLIMSTNGGKVRPGLSSFVDNPWDIATYLMPLLINAASLIPKEVVQETRLFIKGTAGMRLLSDEIQSRIWDAVFSDLTNSSICTVPLKYERVNMGTINGHDEAFYAVLASNYIAGRIDEKLRRVGSNKIVGALDMGGSSNQLILHVTAPAMGAVTDEHVSNKDSPRLTNDDFWSHSWLNYGVERVRDKVLQRIYRKYSAPDKISSLSTAANATIENPCAFPQHSEEYQGSMLTGTGEGTKCVDLIVDTLWGGEAGEGAHDCCLYNHFAADADELRSRCTAESVVCGVDQKRPPSPVGHDFFAMSVYFYAFDCIRQLGDTGLPAWPNPTVAELEQAALSFCGLDWAVVRQRHEDNAHPYTLPHQLSDRCLEGLYMVLLLERGFGFQRHERAITYALEIEGQEVEWTLGFALFVMYDLRDDDSHGGEL